MRTVYLNGAYMPENLAKISIFDRAVLFGDAAYEGTPVLNGKLVAFDGHMQRLQNSLRELAMPDCSAEADLLAIHRELIKRNSISDGLVYVQISRGAPPDRDYFFPDATVAPTLFLFTQSFPGFANTPLAETGLRIISLPDQRWARRDIKSTQLLYQSMAKMQARAAGCDDAWLLEDGFVTEGTSNNAGIIRDGALITHPLGSDILAGVTRKAVLELAAAEKLAIVERPFSIDEARDADEAFITSSMNFVMPVVEIDGTKIGRGLPGSHCRRLRALCIAEAIKTAI